MRPFHGDVAGLTSLRLRRLLCFLSRWNLSDTAHALEQETGVSFMPEYLRPLLTQDKWAEAEAYVAGLVDLEDCSRLASLVLARIRVFGVMSKFAVGEASTASAASFRRAEAGLLAHPDLHAVRRVLDSMRSDPVKASRLYGHIHPGAVEAIMKWVAKCPELKFKIRPPPRCPFDRTYIVSLGPRFWECKRRGQKNKAGRRIAAHIIARCFMQRSGGFF
ncbi:uncharacterized protein LOC123397928 isoform X2 [Hordeum vulgare subsp. vulgare]|uniref:uncharacterized protein LOC123397928 isoform X2 n=1 Tax=Hordeum vulgare subsp. vulgare TaxID=112509 RepID=UPI00162B34C6|nr:uncharacterized protein LOC123397928 isoform X2 [Hordeum vulgare subsp. vulgare]